jgi:hypothetical protein
VEAFTVAHSCVIGNRPCESGGPEKIDVVVDALRDKLAEADGPVTLITAGPALFCQLGGRRRRRDCRIVRF